MVGFGANGRIFNGRVMKNSKFWEKLSQDQLNISVVRELTKVKQKIFYVSVDDKIFQLLPNFMKHYTRVALTDKKRIYNL